MKKIAVIVSLGLASFNSYSADVPGATQTGTITVKGSAYTSACTTNPTTAVSLALPTTSSAEYKAKGDMSPKGKTEAIALVCKDIPGMYLTVAGTPDDTNTSLFKIPVGSGKATGVALKLQVATLLEPNDLVDVMPNKETRFIQKNGTSNMGFTYTAQAVATADKVTSGDLATTLTWTARYN